MEGTRSGTLDRGTVEAVLETVSEWITPEQVVIRGALQPLVQN